MKSLELNKIQFKLMKPSKHLLILFSLAAIAPWVSAQEIGEQIEDCDLTLKEVHVMNMKNLEERLIAINPDLQKTEAQYEAAIYEHRSKIASLFPTLSFELAAQPNYSSSEKQKYFDGINYIKEDSDLYYSYLPYINASVDVDIFNMPKYKQINAASANVNASLYSHKANKRHLLSELFENYVQFQGMEKQLKDLKGVLKILSSITLRFEKLYDNNFATLQQVIQQKANTSMLTSQYLDNKKELESIRTKLEALIVDNVDEYIKIAELPNPACISNVSNIEQLRDDLANNFEPLKELLARSEELNAQASAQLAQYLPVINASLNSSYYYQSGNLTDAGSSNEYSNYYEIYPMISFKIKLNSFGMEAKSAKSLNLKAKSYDKQYSNLLNQEISTLNLNVANLSTNQEIYKQNRLNTTLNQQKLENEGKLTDAGFSSFTDFILAQKDLFESVQRLNSSKIKSFQNIIEIKSKTKADFNTVELFN